MSTDQHVADHPENPRAQQDAVLFDRLQRFVDRHGVVDAAETLGVNYRTLNRCLENATLSRRVREAARKLPEDDDGEQPPPATEDQGTMEQRVGALEQAIGEMAGAQADVQARLARLEAAVGSEQPTAEPPTPEQPNDEDDPEKWVPPKRGFGMPRPGVVTMEVQDDEAVAFGPAAALLAEWREIRNRSTGSGSGVDRARAAERRWELEVAMIGEFGLTLPPEEEPLDHERRHDHIRWRTKALVRTRRIRERRECRRAIRRFLTLGLWWD